MNIVDINFPEDLIDELINQSCIPFEKMSDAAQKFLMTNSANVEYYSTYLQEWCPSDINPRQWRLQAYRLDLKKEHIPLFVRVC